MRTNWRKMQLIETLAGFPFCFMNQQFMLSIYSGQFRLFESIPAGKSTKIAQSGTLEKVTLPRVTLLFSGGTVQLVVKGKGHEKNRRQN